MPNDGWMAMPQTMAHDALAMVEYGDQGSVLLFTDNRPGAERAQRMAGLLGLRVSDKSSIQDASARLERQVSARAVLVDVEADQGAEFDMLVDLLNASAAASRFGSVISAPLELVDRVASRVTHPDVHHLCAPSELDWVAALGAVSSRPEARLHEARKGDRLHELSEEVGRIANILASLSDEDVRAAGAEGGGDDSREGVDAGIVRAIIRARRLRDQYFHSELFADPAWDMLLDLFAARLEEQRVAVSSLCIAAAVPATTALRWIKTLTDHGLFVRAADPQDGRRVYIELSDHAAAALQAYLRAAQRVSPLIL